MSAIYFENLNTFFAFVGKNISADIDKQFLWKALEICKWTAKEKIINHSGNNILNEQFFNSALSIDNLTAIENNTEQPLLAKYAYDLKEKFITDPVIGAIPYSIQQNLSEYSKEKEKETFKISHLAKMGHYTLLSLIAVVIYYAFSFFGSIALLGLGVFGIYWGVLKILKKISMKNKEKSIVNIIKKNISIPKKENSNYDTTFQNKLMSIGKWDTTKISGTLLEEINNLKKQMILFSQIYASKKNVNNLYMEQDILKMNNEHIPLFIEQIENKSYDETVLSQTINTMTTLIQSYIAELIWENKLDISAKNKYWLKKVAEQEGNF